MCVSSSSSWMIMIYRWVYDGPKHGAPFSSRLALPSYIPCTCQKMSGMLPDKKKKTERERERERSQEHDRVARWSKGNYKYWNIDFDIVMKTRTKWCKQTVISLALEGLPPTNEHHTTIWKNRVKHFVMSSNTPTACCIGLVVVSGNQVNLYHRRREYLQQRAAHRAGVHI